MAILSWTTSSCTPPTQNTPRCSASGREAKKVSLRVVLVLTEKETHDRPILVGQPHRVVHPASSSSSDWLTAVQEIGRSRPRGRRANKALAKVPNRRLQGRGVDPSSPSPCSVGRHRRRNGLVPEVRRRLEEGCWRKGRARRVGVRTVNHLRRRFGRGVRKRRRVSRLVG